MNEPTRIFDIFEMFKKEPDTLGGMYFAEKISENWVKYTTEEYERVSYELSSGFLELGLKKGDKVATVTTNRPQWNFIDMGILQIGGVHVTVYPTITDEEFDYIFRHSESKYIFVANRILYKKIKPIADKINTIKGVYVFDDVENTPNWKEIAIKGQKELEKNFDKIEKIKSEVSEDDLATLIYTSGTTGIPKGVMLSHKNVLSNSKASVHRLHLNFSHKVLSFLPLSHVFAHMTSYIYQMKGVSIYYADNVAKVVDYIHELQVDGFITVPRLLEAIFEKISSKAKKLSPIKRKMFEFSLKVAEEYHPYTKMKPAYKMKYDFVNKLVYSQWRKALSPNVIFLGVGGSSLSPRLARIFWAAGFRVFEGYGLTETSPIIAVNYDQPNKVKLGTVGTVLEGVEVKIAEDGEILAKGPNVMLGYYNEPDLTAEMFDEEGWFKTGDIGIVDEEGFLKITDRKKEIFKLSSGKYIAPQMIENKLKESFLINQAMVIGENQKFPGALISPNFEFFEDWAKNEKIEVNNSHELVDLPKVKEAIQKEIININKKLGEHEKIRKFQIIYHDFSIKTGELSNTLKLKRKVIAEKYHEFIDKIYPKNSDDE
ncbi:MAG: long-chain fatty acid--CoA ligase [Bacteroidales bacterium]|nr:long-chain fatty acid--CoA ligase [Bacteroidales bacterium]